MTEPARSGQEDATAAEPSAVAPVVIVAGDDLLFAAEIASALDPLGYRPLVARTADAFHAALVGSAPPAAVILNLASYRFDAIAAIREAKSGSASRGIPLLGFCGHADAARREAARTAGCDLIATNGEVASALPRLLRTLLAPSPAPGVQPIQERNLP